MRRVGVKWAASVLSVLLVLAFIGSVRCSLSVRLESPWHPLVIAGVYRGAVGVTWFQDGVASGQMSRITTR